jgi:hypothetical protein
MGSSERIMALFDYFVNSSSVWWLHLSFLVFLRKRPARKVFKVDRFEAAETGVSFLLIIERLPESFISYRSFHLGWWKVEAQCIAFAFIKITAVLEVLWTG